MYCGLCGSDRVSPEFIPLAQPHGTHWCAECCAYVRTTDGFLGKIAHTAIVLAVLLKWQFLVVFFVWAFAELF